MKENYTRILEKVGTMPMRHLGAITCTGPIGFKDFEISKEEFNDAVLYIQSNNLTKLCAIKEGDVIIMAYGLPN